MCQITIKDMCVMYIDIYIPLYILFHSIVYYAIIAIIQFLAEGFCVVNYFNCTIFCASVLS